MRKRKVVAIVLTVAMVFQFCLFSSQGAWAEQVMAQGDAAQSEEVNPGDSSDGIEDAEGAGETTPGVDVSPAESDNSGSSVDDNSDNVDTNAEEPEDSPAD